MVPQFGIFRWDPGANQQDRVVVGVEIGQHPQRADHGGALGRVVVQMATVHLAEQPVGGQPHRVAPKQEHQTLDVVPQDGFAVDEL